MKKAAAAYTRAIKAAGEDGSVAGLASLRSNRAAALTKLNKAQQALQDAERITELRPDWEKGWYRKGSALDAQGRLEEALEAFQRAQELAPGNKDIARKVADLSRRVKRGNSRSERRQRGSSSPTDDKRRWLDGKLVKHFLDRVSNILSGSAVKSLERALTVADKEPSPEQAARSVVDALPLDESEHDWRASISAFLDIAKRGSGSALEDAALELERLREERSLGARLPIPPAEGAPRALVKACSCADPPTARQALEAAGSAISKAGKELGPVEAFDNPGVAGLLDGHLLEVCHRWLEAGEEAPPQVTEGAAGTLHNALAQARRAGAKRSADKMGDEAGEVYTQLCSALAREGNPLEADTEAAWDENRAHEFFAPLAPLIGDDARAAKALSREALCRARASVVDAVAAGQEGLASASCTVLALLERLARSGSPIDAVKLLSRREEAASLQREARLHRDRYSRLAAAVDKLPLAQQQPSQ